MPGFMPGIHVLFLDALKTWMASELGLARVLDYECRKSDKPDLR
jgi:hypothetical protein